GRGHFSRASGLAFADNRRLKSSVGCPAGPPLPSRARRERSRPPRPSPRGPERGSDGLVRGIAMSQREWHAAAGAALASPRPHDAAASAGRAPREGEAEHPPWEEVFPALTPSQQLELLALAQKQGLLLAEQIPSPPEAPQLVDTARAVLARVFTA